MGIWHYNGRVDFVSEVCSHGSARSGSPSGATERSEVGTDARAEGYTAIGCGEGD